MHFGQIVRWIGTVLGALAIMWPGAVQAVPSYARQTGQACVACHVSFPELTPYGRLFKLSGYTLGTTQLFPLAAMAIGSITQVNSTQGNDAGFPKNGDPVLEGGSLFVAGKLSDHVGLFSQWTYNNLNAKPQADGTTQFSGHTSVDNNDIRLVDHISREDLDLIYGLTLNNNPTVQDVWNSTPAFAFPFQSSRIAGVWGITPPATLIEGGLAQQVAGLSAYAFLNKSWYFELGGYRTADGAFSVLSHGAEIDSRLQGTNPYWRFAYNREWDSHSLSIGTFGMNARVNIDPTDSTSPTDHFRDIGVDMQYQYLAEPHSASAQLSLIHEHTNWDASHIGVDRENSSSTLNSFHLKGSYWYQRKYGVTLGVFDQRGSEDNVAFPVTNRPDTRGYITELNYMIQPYWRLALQYTGYLKLNGATNNFDGNGHNASDNNTAYLYTWIAF
ncbi:cytochrome c [Pseudogulbenkiania sp. NH8B]|uniref:hypothetical protein n=1 Tax=Pseudogulbenkiania sp. (strain NH8B) TaxID=748280 RepID=UPI000227A836|nr:hypothetical protein [Pseudogulbenkiania sp. NH8B]BAK78471.1 cytochrome c [Pseudogulbenkiania sp. NH8B]